MGHIYPEGKSTCSECGITKAAEAQLSEETRREYENKCINYRTHIGPMLKALDVVVKLTKRKPGSKGWFECPLCKTKLHYFVMDNGHTRGCCETEKCVNWLE